jgi:hypothetical protein
MREPRDHARGRRKISFNFTTRRLREIERIIALRHFFVPQTDDDDMYLVPVTQLLRRNLEKTIGMPTSHDVLDRLKVWAERWAPMTPDGRLEEIVGIAMARPRLDKADPLGSKLRLSDAERTYLRITTIGAYDFNKAARKRRNLLRKRERDRITSAERRIQRGAQPRTTYLAQCLSATAPWKTEGISRRTWERRRRKRQKGK